MFVIMTNRVCCIIDFDGFTFRNYTNSNTSQKEFLIREIGFVRIDPEFGEFLAQSYRFDLRFYNFSHCQDAWHTIHHQTKFITGLSLKPQPGEKVHKYCTINQCLRSIYKLCRQSRRDIVAFKGGIYEKKYLDELNIPNLDLNKYGCPKYTELLKQNVVRSPIVDCGYHLKIAEEVTVVHCPKAEVAAFRDWLMLYYPPWNGKVIPPDTCGSTDDSSPALSLAGSCSDLSSSSACN